MTDLPIPEDDPHFELWRLAVVAWLRMRAAEMGVSPDEVVRLENLAAAWKAAYSGWVRLKVRGESDAVVKESARGAFVEGFQRFARESVRSGLLTPALQADLRHWITRAMMGEKAGPMVGGRLSATPRTPER